ncbi:MAG: hypothetical protein ACOYXS_11460 [Chloroflexota bacterium]
MSRRSPRGLVLVASLALAVAFPSAAAATHSWGGYHWARTANPFTLNLADNVNTAWDAYLATTSSDWSVSTVLDTSIVAGGAKPRNCRPTTGRVEVCNASYGSTGWLGVAQIWASGLHITQGTVKVNDTYFNTSAYNTPAWREMVMCQEVGHTLGLDHQDTTFDNTNLGTCMDYTSNPVGPPSNEHPNQHDYDELVTIYSHLDSTTTALATAPGKGNGAPDGAEAAGWGQLVALTNGGRTALYALDLGNGQKVFTFVIWA